MVKDRKLWLWALVPGSIIVPICGLTVLIDGADGPKGKWALYLGIIVAGNMVLTVLRLATGQKRSEMKQQQSVATPSPWDSEIPR